MSTIGTRVREHGKEFDQAFKSKSIGSTVVVILLIDNWAQDEGVERGIWIGGSCVP
jgi:hypothetical protein